MAINQTFIFPVFAHCAMPPLSCVVVGLKCKRDCIHHGSETAELNIRIGIKQTAVQWWVWLHCMGGAGRCWGLLRTASGLRQSRCFSRLEAALEVLLEAGVEVELRERAGEPCPALPPVCSSADTAGWCSRTPSTTSNRFLASIART